MDDTTATLVRALLSQLWVIALPFLSALLIHQVKRLPVVWQAALQHAAQIGVYAAEQYGQDELLQARWGGKKAYAVAIAGAQLTRVGINVDASQLDAAIEARVLEMTHQVLPAVLAGPTIIAPPAPPVVPLPPTPPVVPIVPSEPGTAGPPTPAMVGPTTAP